MLRIFRFDTLPKIQGAVEVPPPVPPRDTPTYISQKYPPHIPPRNIATYTSQKYTHIYLPEIHPHIPPRNAPTYISQQVVMVS